MSSCWVWLCHRPVETLCLTSWCTTGSAWLSAEEDLDHSFLIVVWMFSWLGGVQLACFGQNHSSYLCSVFHVGPAEAKSGRFSSATSSDCLLSVPVFAWLGGASHGDLLSYFLVSLEPTGIVWWWCVLLLAALSWDLCPLPSGAVCLVGGGQEKQPVWERSSF